MGQLNYVWSNSSMICKIKDNALLAFRKIVLIETLSGNFMENLLGINIKKIQSEMFVSDSRASCTTLFGTYKLLRLFRIPIMIIILKSLFGRNIANFWLESLNALGLYMSTASFERCIFVCLANASIVINPGKGKHRVGLYRIQFSVELVRGMNWNSIQAPTLQLH